jgi:TonB family protein
MTAHVAELDPQQPIRGSFAASVTLHLSMTFLIFAWGWLQSREHDRFGDPNPGFGPATVETVSAIPLPSRQARPNPVANDTESLTPAKSKPELKKKFLDPDDPDAIALRYEKKKRKLSKKELQQLALQRYEKTKPSDNQVYSSSGAAMSNPEMFNIRGGGGQLGLGSANPFGNQFGWYADLIRQRVGEKWRTQEVEAAVQTAPLVIVSFRILKNGEVRDIKLEKSGGNYSLNQSTMRAIQEASPLPPLPTEFRRDSATVEFHFQFKR